VAAETRRCTSCGSDADDVVAVRRVYVTPAAWDTEEKVEVVDELEQWCFPCRTHYPHEEVGVDGSAGGAVDDPA
jgi:hypothetical protein